ncbi:MAG: glycosidase [Bacteroidetes bacterium]|nr:glycosidase [Bacteroidota bacterium]
MKVTVNRNDVIFSPDPKRIIARFFYLSDERGMDVIRRVMTMPEDEIAIVVNQVLRNFSKRHRNISQVFEKHFKKVGHLFDKLKIDTDSFSLYRKLLIGSYFTHEFSIESAALFNPSIVEHPDQTELDQGEKRVILSFRATGEGHISSLVFRGGILDQNNNMTFKPAGHLLDQAYSSLKYVYNKDFFIKRLKETLEFNHKLSPESLLDKLNFEFTYGELKYYIDELKRKSKYTKTQKLILDQILWLALSHYEIEFSLDTALSERVIFPVSYSEKNGIEDARFVRFTDDNGEVTYYATYTAYDGMVILPKLIETQSFYKFKSSAIHGEISSNKGMALFPRKINGKYAMLCRIDGVNNYIAFSDNINIWRTATLLQEPKYPWEFIQIGNSGSPIETKEGWLVITHAVGAMREYVIGASLFDLDNPEKEIGRLKTPLMIPNEKEREGYVPNVIYSCGSIVHHNNLIIPYAMSDYASSFAFINMDELLHALKNPE